MTLVPITAVDVIERLRIIQSLCEDIANRLEDEATAQTIPRNYEYDGRRAALLDIANDIGNTIRSLNDINDADTVQRQVQALLAHIEARKRQNEEEQTRNQDYQHNFRLNGLYFTPRGATAGCDKALEWLHESLKSVGLPPSPTV